MAATIINRPRSALDQRGGLRYETLDHKRSCLGEHVELLLSNVVIAMAATIISRPDPHWTSVNGGLRYETLDHKPLVPRRAPWGLRYETLDHKRSCLGEHVELLPSNARHRDGGDDHQQTPIRIGPA
ncbi:hypothetical protein EVAR_5004_1 [Eumeta japonica]|uniref:Uncharacterized protein n=1 Tax=Eumeta variegata TaxID=151549 RepID=A0A4C1SU05_EUMVA|nr:hypothetical protein EVAR_5004_1 [Eumeta japonica]